MKRIVCICNTYFQLLACIQLKLTLFRNESVTLILSDHSNNAEEVFKNINRRKLFEDCYYIKTKRSSKEMRNLKYRIRTINSFISGNSKLWIELGLGTQDEIMYFNSTNEIYSLFSYLYEKNNEIKVSRFEEGVLSYNLNGYSKKKNFVMSIIRGMMKKSTLRDRCTNFYCFYPQFYNGELNVVQIPEIQANGEMGDILSDIFEIDEVGTAYDSKYIYFSSVYDFEGGEPIGELELIEQIAELVGRNNLLVKVHPRDDISRFKKRGLRVDNNSNIPWEVIQLKHDFSKHVFITANSTSVLSVSLLQKNSPKIFYVHNLCNTDGNPTAQKTISEINKIVSSSFVKDREIDVKIACRIEDLLE